MGSDGNGRHRGFQIGRAQSLAKEVRVTIKNWPAAERPRERLLAQGPTGMSEAELLAVFLRTGIPGKSAIDVAREALMRFGGLNGLLSAPVRDLQQVGGFGPAKAAQLHAVLELGRRALREHARKETVLNSPARVRDYLTLLLRNEKAEAFVGVFLDSQTHLLADEVLFRGTLTQTSVYPREVVKRALTHNAGVRVLDHLIIAGGASMSFAERGLL
jgi:DNA repair protein RadC